MPSEKQIAANRANAKRSTGPKTAAGRAKSRRNAYQHGLSSELPFNDPEIRTRIDALTEALLAGEEPTEEKLAAAHDFASAQVQLMQVGKVRRNMLSDLQQHFDPKKLSRLVACIVTSVGLTPSAGARLKNLQRPSDGRVTSANARIGLNHKAKVANDAADWCQLSSSKVCRPKSDSWPIPPRRSASARR